MAGSALSLVMEEKTTTTTVLIGRLTALRGGVAAFARATAEAMPQRLSSRSPILAAVAGATSVGWLGGHIGFAGAASIIASTMIASALSPVLMEAQGHAESGAGGPDGAATAGVEYWRAIVDAMADATVVVDEGATVLHANEMAREMFPRLRVGRPISHGSRHPELIAAFERAQTSTEQIVAQLVESFPIDRRISVAVSRIARDERYGRAPYFLATFRDLSEQDRLAHMRADFIANASHELRTPLASLRGFVETLQGPARNDAAARERFLALMASQAERMTRLIDDLLSLSRVEMRVHLPPRGVVDLNEVAHYVAQTLEPMAKAARTTLKLEQSGGVAQARGERDEIVQVLQNLVQNALKYGRADGHVTIAVRSLAKSTEGTPRIAVSVSDDGPGIAPEHLPRLTERFYRVNVASSRDKGGTGLGLAIVKHIVTRHRGELKIESALGKGSTFTVLLDALPNGTSL
jgi:two-component system phosphate regulon sensor histidine kinase PhoR